MKIWNNLSACWFWVFPKVNNARLLKFFGLATICSLLWILTAQNNEEGCVSCDVPVAVKLGRVGYIGLPVGCLFHDGIIVCNDLGRLERVQLEHVYNYRR